MGDISRVCPASYYTILMMEGMKMHCAMSVQQFVAVALLPRLLPLGPVENCVTGGWSKGCVYAYNCALQLEASLQGVRACFWIDVRTLVPLRDRSMLAAVAVLLGAQRRELRARAVVVDPSLDFEEVPKRLPRVHLVEFQCPLRKGQAAFMQEDSEIDARRCLYVRAGETQLFLDSDHLVLGSECYWDIARRVRGVAVKVA